MSLGNKVAQCVGLWLAEGDTKSIAELTLTNNSSEVIIFFHNVIISSFNSENKPRVYVYTSSNNLNTNLPICVIHKHYVDKRSNKPYFIWRLADRKLIGKWKNIVELSKRNPRLYPFILQGFFAGEGNVKYLEK